MLMRHVPTRNRPNLTGELMMIAVAKDMNAPIMCLTEPCRVGSVGSVSASRTVGREFASQPGHTKDHHKNGANCLPA